MDRKKKKLPESLRYKTIDLRKGMPTAGPKPVRPMHFATPKQPVSPVPLKTPGEQEPVERFEPPAQEVAQVTAKKSKKPLTPILLMLFAVGLLLVSIYIFVLMTLPKIQQKSLAEVQKTAETAIKEDKNMLLIPSTGIQSEIQEGSAEVLDKGVVWHRFPDRGNPMNGGNTILTGHSFVWGYTPQEVTKQSIFYNLHGVKPGDEIVVIWDKKKYSYKVSEIKTVKPNASEIEDKTKDPILTIYTCTTGGSADGRVVVIAKPSS